jgi:glutathione S-transferase
MISRLALVAPPVLYHIEISHYNEKVRWTLDYKGIPHVRKAPPPIFHTLWAFAMTRGATFPVLKMNGDTIGDSTRIIEALERAYPEPPLYPADPAERARALELEEFFDEELAPHIRRALFAEVTRDREAFAWAAAPTGGRAVHAGFKGTAALAGPLLRLRYGINPESTDAGWGKTYAALDRLEAELGGRDYLVGDSFTVADLTAASLFHPLVRPDEAQYELPEPLPPAIVERRDAVAARPGFRWVKEIYRRHRGQSAEVAA